MAAVRAAALAGGRAACCCQRMPAAARHHHPSLRAATPPALRRSATTDSASQPPPPPPSPLIDAAGRARAEAYLDAVLAAAPDLNLTAVRTRGPALARHLADSLDFLPPLDALAAGRTASDGAPFSVIDVGAGAGYPGSVLAAARPAWRVTLLDALRKRMDFAAGAAAGVGLGNAVPVWGRAEDVGKAVGSGEEGGGKARKRNKSGDAAAAAPTAAAPPPASSSSLAAPAGSHREAHDAAVARAVADTRVLAELCLPLVRPGGLWVAAKGPDPGAEVDAAGPAIAALGGAVEALLSLPPLMPGGPARSLLVVRKVGRTPDRYPRRAGLPGKRPL